MIEQLIVGFLVMNGMGFLLMGIDKSRARRDRWRVPEKRLFLVAAAGGALGVWAGMRRFRHKTKHGAFVYGIPALTIWNAVLYGAAFAYASGAAQ